MSPKAPMARRKIPRRARPEAFAPRDARFRFLTENSRDIYFSMRFPEGRYEYISPVVQELFGFAPQDFYDDSATLLRCIAPQWREQVRAWLGEIALGQVAESYEFQVVDVAGRLRWIEQRQVFAPTPDGSAMLLQGVAADITELREANEALRQSEERFRELAESWTEQVLLRINLDTGAAEYVSPSMERLFGHKPGDVCCGAPPIQIIAPEWREQIGLWMEENRQGVMRPEYQYEILDARGGRHWVSARGALVSDAQGRPGLVQLVIFDITERKRLEEALAHSEALLQAMLRNLPFDFWARDTNIRSILQSDESIRLWGDLGAGPGAEDHIDEETRATWRETDRKVMAGSPLTEERTLRLPSGEVRTFQSVVAQIKDGEAVLGLLGVNVDITERKATEEALRLSNERYALLAENVVDVIWSTDENLRWTYLTPSAELLSGIPLARLLAMRFDELFTPRSLQAVAAAMRLRQEERARGLPRVTRTLEMELIRADGSLVPLEVLIQPLYGPDGRISGYCGTSRDITQRKEAEAALRTSEERYALALRGASDGLWDWDLVADVVYYSDRWKEILGYAPEEIQHDPEEWISRIHPEDHERVLAENRRCIDAEAPVFQVEYRLRHKDGSYRWIFGRGASLTDASGRVIRMAGAHTDITERKQAEEALHRSERLFRKLLESMHEGVWAMAADRRTTFVNERLCAMLGYSAEELLGMTPLDVLDGAQKALAMERFQERQLGHAGVEDYELRRKDGTRFPAQVMSSPMLDEAGRFEGLVSGVVDLTERKRMEGELRRNQARFEALFELSRLTTATEAQTAAYALREALRLTESTAGALFSVSPDGTKLTPLASEGGQGGQAGQGPPDFATVGPTPWAAVFASRQPMLLNDFSAYAGQLPPGHMPLSRFLAVPALDGERPAVILGLTGKAKPYTPDDRLQVSLLLDGMWRVLRGRRDEARIRASLREKEALLREVQHRVKNNLQVVSSLLDMAGRRLSGPEARQSLEEVRAKVQAMSLVHAQLHDEGEAGGMDLERYVRALFRQLREVYSGGMDLSLSVQFDPLVLGPDQAVPLGLALNEALANVFKHARLAGRDGEGRAGRVDIRAWQEPDGLVSIEVCDDGPGLPAGLSPERAGSLGMKLMHGLVRRQLGGELDIESRAAGQTSDQASALGGVCVRIRFRPNKAT